MGSTKSGAAHWAAVIALCAKAFFNIGEDDGMKRTTVKVAKTSAMRTVYAVLDYWLTFVSAAFIIVMQKQFGYQGFELFFLMWAFDILVACAFVATWKRTGEDVTLGESFRRAADILHQESRFAGYLAFAGVILKATFWDGPEHIVIFFHKELRTDLRMLLALLALTALQAAIWTPTFVWGFESVSELISYLFR